MQNKHCALTYYVYATSQILTEGTNYNLLSYFKNYVMKKTFILIGFILFANVLFGQSKVDSLVEAGVKRNDIGDFKAAIKLYEEALKIDSNSALANSEIAMTYMYINEFEKSIAHCDIVINQNDQYLVQAYVTKGSCLDCMGKTKESIAVLENGIEQFGNHYLLCYNLGLDYYKIKNYDKAIIAFQAAIKSKPDHAGSHMALGCVMADLNKKAQCFLCLNYFLLLEPNTLRSKAVYDLMQRQFFGNVKKKKDEAKQVNINVDSNHKNSDFLTFDLLISLMGASSSLKGHNDEIEDKSFIEFTTLFFRALGYEKKKGNSGFWWDFYVPFFYDLVKTEHMTTYCNSIRISLNDDADNWIKNHQDNLKSFIHWLLNR